MRTNTQTVFHPEIVICKPGPIRINKLVTKPDEIQTYLDKYILKNNNPTKSKRPFSLISNNPKTRPSTLFSMDMSDDNSDEDDHFKSKSLFSDDEIGGRHYKRKSHKRKSHKRKSHKRKSHKRKSHKRK